MLLQMILLQPQMLLQSTLRPLPKNGVRPGALSERYGVISSAARVRDRPAPAVQKAVPPPNAAAKALAQSSMKPLPPNSMRGAASASARASQPGGMPHQSQQSARPPAIGQQSSRLRRRPGDDATDATSLERTATSGSVQAPTAVLASSAGPPPPEPPASRGEQPFGSMTWKASAGSSLTARHV